MKKDFTIHTRLTHIGGKQTPCLLVPGDLSSREAVFCSSFASIANFMAPSIHVEIMDDDEAMREDWQQVGDDLVIA